MQIQFAYSTNAFKKFTLEAAIKKIALSGFDGVEIMADAPHLYPPDYGAPRKLNRLKNLLIKTGLAVSNLNTFTLCAIGDMHHPSWIERDKKLRGLRIQHTKACLCLAKELDCPNISIQPGGRNEHFTRKKAEDTFFAGLQEVIPLAEDLDVNILIEPEPKLLFENSRQFEKFAARFKTDIIGLNCDIGHFYCAGEDPAEVILRLHKYIGHIHIEDIRNRAHNHLICGQGEIDYKPIFKALEKIDYHGFISVELYPYQDTPVEAGRKSLKHLRRILQK